MLLCCFEDNRINFRIILFKVGMERSEFKLPWIVQALLTQNGGRVIEQEEIEKTLKVCSAQDIGDLVKKCDGFLFCRNSINPYKAVSKLDSNRLKAKFHLMDKILKLAPDNLLVAGGSVVLNFFSSSSNTCHFIISGELLECCQQ